MSRLVIICCLLGFDFSIVLSREVRGIEEKITVHNKLVIFDYQPLKNNTLLYATCDKLDVQNFSEQTTMNCLINLLSYPTADKIKTSTCQVNYQTPNGSYIRNFFQLKLLYSDQIIFMWCESFYNEEPNILARQLVYRTLDMSSCKFVEKKIDFVDSSRSIDVNKFYVVPHLDSFDLYFKNETLCGVMMCGLTQDKRGSIINGPVPSYLPSSHFKDDTFVYPIKQGSSALGHFILSSSKFSLVSSNFGEIKYLMDYPKSVGSLAFSCNNGYLGFCWQKEENANQFNCTQFNSHAEETMSYALGQNYHKFGTWLALSNSQDGGMLLLTNNCNDQSWCRSNIDAVQFNVYKVQRLTHGYVINLIERFTGVDCNYAKEVKTEIYEQENKDICFSVTCYVKQGDTGDAHIYLLSKCVNISNVELNTQRIRENQCDDSFDPNCNPLILT